MSKLSEIFKRALSPFTNKSNSQQAYNDLEEGKKISLNMNSDRYTYGNREDNKYGKKMFYRKICVYSPEFLKTSDCDCNKLSSHTKRNKHDKQSHYNRRKTTKIFF